MSGCYVNPHGVVHDICTLSKVGIVIQFLRWDLSLRFRVSSHLIWSSLTACRHQAERLGVHTTHNSKALKQGVHSNPDPRPLISGCALCLHSWL